MLLRVSNAGLQDDLRDTMRVYSEEKHQLRAHLSTLRLDLSQLHRDDRTTVSSSDQSCAASHLSFPTSDVEPELKRLMEEEEDGAEEKMGVMSARTQVTATDMSARTQVTGTGVMSARTHVTATDTTTGAVLASSLQLPALKGIHPYKHTSKTNNPHKNLRFSSQTVSTTQVPTDNKDVLDGGGSTKRSFLRDDEWDMGGTGQGQEAKERQKFKELQKNQDMLRNIGRANLREKRMSLIRLPTITSAKKRRQTTWDSGKNVSRPAGKSTVFEAHPYLEDSGKIKKKNFRIPLIRDPKRSEIQLDPDMPRQPDQLRKKKVQFTRPGEMNMSLVTVSNPNMTVTGGGGGGGILNTSSLTTSSTAIASSVSEDNHSESRMGGESLNTTLADTTMGDTSFQDITFDPQQIKVLAQRGSLDKAAGTTHLNQDIGDGSVLEETSTTKFSEELANMKPGDLPPLKIKTLRRKNVFLHDLNMSGIAGVSGAQAQSKGNWDKSSDLSVLTKISRLSLETEEWKNSFMSVPDPDKRKKTLSDIMFAVRTRMRENEASLRFGETPRPSDEGYGFLVADPFQQHKSPRRSNKTPRKVVKGQSVRGAASLQLPPKRRSTGDQGGKTAAQLQGYLRKVYRHRRHLPAGGDSSTRSNKSVQSHQGTAENSGELRQSCSQETASLDKHRGMGAVPVPQHA